MGKNYEGMSTCDNVKPIVLRNYAAAYEIISSLFYTCSVFLHGFDVVQKSQPLHQNNIRLRALQQRLSQELKASIHLSRYLLIQTSMYIPTYSHRSIKITLRKTKIYIKNKGGRG